MTTRDEVLYRVNLSIFYGCSGLLVLLLVVQAGSVLSVAGLAVAVLGSALSLHWLSPRVLGRRRRRGPERR